MSSDEERGSPKLANTNEKTVVEQRQSNVQLYNNVEVVLIEVNVILLIASYKALWDDATQPR